MISGDLKYAARLLRTLADAERARLSDDWEAVTQALDSVDPVEAYGLSAQLDAEAAIRSAGGRRATDRVRRAVW